MAPEPFPADARMYTLVALRSDDLNELVNQVHEDHGVYETTNRRKDSTTYYEVDAWVDATLEDMGTETFTIDAQEY